MDKNSKYILSIVSILIFHIFQKLFNGIFSLKYSYSFFCSCKWVIFPIHSSVRIEIKTKEKEKYFSNKCQIRWISISKHTLRDSFISIAWNLRCGNTMYKSLTMIKENAASKNLINLQFWNLRRAFCYQQLFNCLIHLVFCYHLIQNPRFNQIGSI